MPALLILMIVFLIVSFIIDFVLDYLNHQQWQKPLPKEISHLYTPEKFEEAKSYHRDNYKLDLISSVFSFVVILAMLFTGGFGKLHNWIATYNSNEIVQTLIFFGILFIASDIISLPFTVYSIFKIEEKYGFNKMSPALFLTDKIKGYILTIILGGGILLAFTWFYNTAGNNFWWYAWIMLTSVTIFFAMFYTSLIVPIFNKLNPLEEGELRSEIVNFTNKVNFPLSNIFLIDGSKRSTKANAYFSGFGKKKTIVLFDTLLKDHSTDELVGILAHEIGHYKKKHVITGIFMSVIQTGIMLFILSLTVGSEALTAAMGSEGVVFHLGLLAFGILYSPLSMFTGLIGSYISRKNEYEADDYAKEHHGAKPLAESLKKLSINHLSNLNPHPWYVFFHYSHPPLVLRLKNLMK
jgi:STE24 endopeptidase